MLNQRTARLWSWLSGHSGLISLAKVRLGPKCRKWRRQKKQVRWIATSLSLSLPKSVVSNMFLISAFPGEKKNLMLGAIRFSYTTPQIKVINAFDGFCIQRLARLAGPSVCNPALGEVRTHAPPHDQLPAAVGRLCLHCQNGWNQEKIQRFFEVPLWPPKKSVQHPSLRTRLGLYWCLPPHLFTANPTPPPFSTARVLKLAEPGAMAPGSCCCGCSAFGGSFSLANRNWNTHNQFWVEVNWKRYDAWYRHSPQL